MALRSTAKQYLERLRIRSALPRFFVLAGGILAVLLLLVFFSYSHMNRNAQQEAKANYERIERLDSLMILLLDAETGVRGHLVTRSESYLEPFHRSQTGFAVLLERIRADYADTAMRAEAAQLEELVYAKMRHLLRIVEIGRLSERIDPGKSGTGESLMSRIRESIGQLRSYQRAENERLAEEAARRLGSVERSQYVLALATLLLIVSLFLVQQRQVALRQRLSELLSAENEHLDALVNARTEELSDLATYLTNARETERSRLAREMHDEFGSLLTAAKIDAGMLLRTLGPQLDADATTRIRRLIDYLGAAIATKRRLVEGLYPPLLHGLGLTDALRALCGDFSSDVSVNLDLPAEDPRLSPDQSLAIYRITQEALTNIRKYAKASRVWVALVVQEGRLTLRIRDDGQGFDMAQVSVKRFGLAGMRHRVQMLHGSLVINSTPGRGTLVEASIPLDS